MIWWISLVFVLSFLLFNAWHPNLVCSKSANRHTNPWHPEYRLPGIPPLLSAKHWTLQICSLDRLCSCTHSDLGHYLHDLLKPSHETWGKRYFSFEDNFSKILYPIGLIPTHRHAFIQKSYLIEGVNVRGF